MIIKFTDDYVKKYPDLYQYVEDSYARKIVTYVLNSAYRQAINLQPWIKAQVDTPAPEVLAFANTIPTVPDADAQIIHILHAVRIFLTYVSDNQSPFHPGVLEYWQTALETITWKEGDCEDGAILLYVLGRIKGIPEDRLLLWAGDVIDPSNPAALAGHCTLLYKPTYYLLNWSIIDWCYYYDGTDIDTRPLYYIEAQDVYCYDHAQNSIDSKYRTMWFSFNDAGSYLNFKFQRK